MWWMTVALAKPTVTALEIAAPPGGGLCPGATFGLDVTAISGSKRSSARIGGAKAQVTAAWELGDASTGKLTMPA
ncbi:MAG: hypothetical protein ABMA64_33050, partial [Myxococcota bacterium]